MGPWLWREAVRVILMQPGWRSANETAARLDCKEAEREVGKSRPRCLLPLRLEFATLPLQLAFRVAVIAAEIALWFLPGPWEDERQADAIRWNAGCRRRGFVRVLLRSLMTARESVADGTAQAVAMGS